jgi:thioredoxin-like negative regulator of GroEL
MSTPPYIVLNQNNFQSSNGKSLRLVGISGVVMVFFKTNNCNYCRSLEPIFVQLARSQPNIKWAVINITTSRDVVKMAQSTTTPIKGVPMLVLYSDGNPFAIYKGERTIQDISMFLNNVIPQIQQKKAFVNKNAPRGGKVTPSSLGINDNVANDNGNLGPSQSDLVSQNDKSAFVPKGSIPHNAPYMSMQYQSMDLQYQ